MSANSNQFECPRDTWWAKGERPANEDESVSPFKIQIADSELDDLKLRLKLTRLPRVFPDKKWELGVNFEYMEELLAHWRDTYDWRVHETRLNENLPQFTTTIDGVELHFAHIKSDVDDAIPLILSHGWPSSFVEFEKIAPLLTSGAGGRQAFHVVAPSLPGFGFSSQAERLGLNHVQCAVMFSKLMARLGYEKYVAHGGDWGVFITTNIALVDPEHVIGIHTLIAPAFIPKELEEKIELSDAEKTRRAGQEFIWDELGYMHQHSTKPHTVGVALSDSPMGLAAWIVEKFQSWTDCSGDIESRASKDELLTNVMIYWLTNSITSSMRFYKENSLNPEQKHSITAPEVVRSVRTPIATPMGVANFPGDILYVPRAHAATRFRNILTWNTYEKGGHFAAWEEAEVLAADICTFAEAVKKLQK